MILAPLLILCFVVIGMMYYFVIRIAVSVEKIERDLDNVNRILCHVSQQVDTVDKIVRGPLAKDYINKDKSWQ